MPLTPRYCSQCGQTLTVQIIEGRNRDVCAECETIFYQNPLPVAAAVVLNERREVLLVKRARQPHKGEWCLPMGFAEIGESIAGAALRELHEEAGVEGRIKRLLDSESYASDYYGDLLIITYEIEKTGGRERAGDDAAATAYFAFDQLPLLAFASNRKALSACLTAHQDDWAIGDSFSTLQAEHDGTMLSDSLIELIQRQAAEVARLWLADVRSNATTPSYRNADVQQLHERATQAIAQFGRWLKGDESGAAITTFYSTLASERRAQGFKSYELLSSLALLKKHIWAFARTHGDCKRPMEMYKLLELSRRVAEFFDKATFRAMREFDMGSPASNPPVK